MEPARRVAFFAPDRPGIANLPVYEETEPGGGRVLRVGTAPGSAGGPGPAPVFYMLPDDRQGPDMVTVRLHETREGPGGKRSYSVDSPETRNPAARGHRVLGRVWPNPSTSLLW